MGILEQGFHFGTKGSLYKNLSDPGSMLFGGAGVSNSLGMKRDGNKGGLFGDKQQGIDWFGSPVTAGTNFQGPARLGALIYGAAMGAGALAGGSAGAGSGAAGGNGFAMPAATAEAPGSVAATQGGTSSLGSGFSPLQALNWGRRGYGAYNMLQGMNGGGPQQQQQGGYPMRQQPQQPPYGSMGQKPLPGSGPFDWLKF